MTRTRTHTWYAVDACRVPTASLMSTDGAEDVPLRLSVCSSPNLRWLISHWNRSILLLFIELSDGATLELSVSIILRADRWINANSIKFDWFIDRIDRNDVCLKEDRPGIYRASMKDRSSWHDLLRRMIYFECLPRESTKRVYHSLPVGNCVVECGMWRWSRTDADSDADGIPAWVDPDVNRHFRPGVAVTKRSRKPEEGHPTEALRQVAFRKVPLDVCPVPHQTPQPFDAAVTS